MRASYYIAVLLDQLEELHPLQSETTHINCGICNDMRAAYKELFRLAKEK